MRLYSIFFVLTINLLFGTSFADDLANSTSADSIKADTAVAIDSTKKDSVVAKVDSTKKDSVATKVDSTKKDSAVAKLDSTKKDSAVAKLDSTKKDSVVAKVDSTKKDSVAAKVDSTKKDSAVAKEQAQRYLHIATNPFTADIFVNGDNINFANKPDYVSPAFIKVPGSGPTIQITLFQREYADTTINVTLSPKDTSYLIVALRQHNDPELTEIQDKILAHRSRRTIGRNLLFASGIPYLVSAVTAYFTYRFIESAKDEKEHIENSIIRSGDSYEKHVKNYHDDRDNARIAKRISAATLGTGLALMTIGVILSF